MKGILDAFFKIRSVTEIDSGKGIEILESSRNSILCKFNNNFYLISVCHYIYENTECYIVLKENRLKIDKSQILCIPELDIMLINVTNMEFTNDKNEIDITSMNYKINHINPNTHLFVIDQYGQVQSTNILNMQLCKFNNLYPEILKYFSTKPDYNLEGYSGSPVYDTDGNILGIVNGYCNDMEYMTLTPFFFIKRIFDELETYGIFGGLCGFYQQYSLYKRKLFITKKEDVDHNIYINNQRTFTKLIPDDIIYEIDDMEVDLRGHVYCNLIGMNIDIKSYITITKTINSITKFKVYRNKNKVYKNIDVIMGNRDYYSSSYTSIKTSKLETIWNKNKLFIKINSALWDYIKRLKRIETDENLFNLFQLKYANKTENNYLLVEDIILNKNIFDNMVSNYIVLKDLIE